MGSSMVLAASRQSFAFARDGALPFSSVLYRMNSFTKTPVNTVWFVCGFSALLGLLVFAGEQAIDAIFALSIVALYVGQWPTVSQFGCTSRDLRVAHFPNIKLIPFRSLQGSLEVTTSRLARSPSDGPVDRWRSLRWRG